MRCRARTTISWVGGGLEVGHRETIKKAVFVPILDLGRQDRDDTACLVRGRPLHVLVMAVPALAPAQHGASDGWPLSGTIARTGLWSHTVTNCLVPPTIRARAGVRAEGHWLASLLKRWVLVSGGIAREHHRLLSGRVRVSVQPTGPEVCRASLEWAVSVCSHAMLGQTSAPEPAQSPR